MPELTPEQVAAFPEMVEACKQALQDIGDLRVCTIAKLESALSACEPKVPKVPTLVEAAEAVQEAIADFLTTGGHKAFEGAVVDAQRGLCLAITREREAQAALDWTLADGTGSSDPIEPKPPARERAAEHAVQAAAEISEATGRDLTPCVATLPATEAVEDFGEPWEYDRAYTLTRGGLIAAEDHHRARYIACTNALAGCNPGRLGELVEAIQNAVEHWTMGGRVDYNSNLSEGICEALARFKPETKEPEPCPS